MKNSINIWFPTVRANSGSDIYTIRLCKALKKIGVNTELTWFSHLYELAPFMMGKKNIPINTDIIHANSWNAFTFYKRDIPLVSTLHHNVFDPQFLPYKSKSQSLYHNWLIHQYEKLSLNKSTINISVSEYTAASYSKTFNINTPEVIPNWIDESVFTPLLNKQSNHTFKLLFIGNHTRRKGADLLPQIMTKLGKGYELHTTGGLRKNNAQNKGSSFIHHGHIPKTTDLVKLYQSCDALLFPSRLEGFGLAALEAQACGLPVIATNCSAFPEVIVNNETGTLCQKDDIDAFVLAIKHLRLNHTKTLNMGLAARSHVLNNFSEQKVINKYIKTYQSLLK